MKFAWARLRPRCAKHRHHIRSGGSLAMPFKYPSGFSATSPETYKRLLNWGLRVQAQPHVKGAYWRGELHGYELMKDL
jgi:hypothetical protein